MKTLLTYLLLSLSVSGFSQTEHKEIIEQIWKPYITSSNDLDATTFMGLHSKDLVHASSDNGSVMGYDEFSSIRSSADQNFKLNRFKRKVEIRFSEHWVNQNLAYEVGVVKTTTLRPSGGATSIFSRIQVMLRKENGVWKIFTSTDSTEGGIITDKEFLEARPLDI